MRLEIAGEGEPQEEPIRLKLRQYGDGVAVHVVDENGDNISHGMLVVFTNSGRLRIINNVDSPLGFILDDAGCISITRE
ncbi:MAG TPA: hypothetical protein ENI27_07565 [bacterium]|nr:hypothetical protein [bacterium]